MNASPCDLLKDHVLLSVSLIGRLGSARVNWTPVVLEREESIPVWANRDAYSSRVHGVHENTTRAFLGHRASIYSNYEAQTKSTARVMRGEPNKRDKGRILYETQPLVIGPPDSALAGFTWREARPRRYNRRLSCGIAHDSR